MPLAQTIGLETLSKYFHLPINDVAKELGVCATVLKKICRKNGIPRWPHRKVFKHLLLYSSFLLVYMGERHIRLLCPFVFGQIGSLFFGVFLFILLFHLHPRTLILMIVVCIVMWYFFIYWYCICRRFPFVEHVAVIAWAPITHERLLVSFRHSGELYSSL